MTHERPVDLHFGLLSPAPGPGSSSRAQEAGEHDVSALYAVLVELAAERARQDARWGEQNHPDGTGGIGRQESALIARDACQAAAVNDRLTWRHILREETAEAYAETDPVRLRVELVQVAAVAIAWIEAIDRRLATDQQ